VVSSKVQNSITNVLGNLQEQLYDISAKNPFVHVKPSKLYQYGSEINRQQERLASIHKKQNFYLKEFGLETTLFVSLFIKWKHPQKEKYYCSPILYKPSRIKRIQKISLDFNINIEEGDWHINPIISSIFLKFFDLKLPRFFAEKDALVSILKSHFNSEGHAFKELLNFSEMEEWQLVDSDAIGTFNYKKSVLGMDYETIIKHPSLSVSEILGFSPLKITKGEVDSIKILPLDNSQKKVVTSASENSTVIQGPPGTGKSHTIVSLIQHFIEQKKTVLFVSEKKSALKVVYDRMGSLKQWVAYFDAEKYPKKSFYQTLKKSYSLVNQHIDKSYTDSFELEQNNSQLFPEQYVSNSPRIGISLAELETFLINSRFSNTEFHPQSQIPDFKSWEMYHEDLCHLEKIALSKWGIKSLSESSFLQINPSVLQENDPIGKIDKRLVELEDTLKIVKSLQTDFSLDLSWDEFTRYSVSASILSLVNKSQMDVLINGTKQYKSFDNWSKKFQITLSKQEKLRALNALWLVKPSIAELNLYEIQRTEQGLFSKFKKRRLHNEFFKNYNGKVNIKSCQPLIDNLKAEFEIDHQLEAAALKLKHDLKLLNPNEDIDNILSIRKRLDSLSHTAYQTILEMDNVTECINALTNIHGKINSFNHIKKYLFKSDLPENLADLSEFISRFRNQIGLLQDYITEAKALLTFPSKILDFIVLNPVRIAELEFKVYYHTLQNEKRFEPYIAGLTGQQLLKDIKNHHTRKSKALKNHISKLSDFQKKKWQEFEQLATTPNSKLGDGEKHTKNAFKQAKRIIIHEINKQQRHLPVKQLLVETGQFLTALQPVWMMNPLAIGERLPLDKGLFDVVIFDESSQIPLEDAIPAIYRASQVIVVGDTKQMPPGLFFSSKTNTVTALDQAQHVYPSVMLNWHYRSQHPALISFSNHHFYDNELNLFPPTNSDYPINFNYISDGVFENGVNLKEAEAIADRYDNLIKNEINEVAIIAFSKDQEMAIRKQIQSNGTEVPESVIIRNLENVQGIEKEIVLISIGYGQTAEGKLRLNFGPVNQEQGERRLNVLFTRAISKMEVYSSIQPEEIGLSENRGVMVLKAFLEHAKNRPSKSRFNQSDSLSKLINEILSNAELDFTFYNHSDGMILNCFVQHSSGKVLIVNPGVDERIVDLSAAIPALIKQFKVVKIILNNDWLNSKERVRKEVLAYFENKA